MRGLMSERQLLISTLIRHAACYHGDVEIVSRLVDRSLHRYTYAEAERRSRRLARALLRLGIGPGDRVATLAWNNFRHFELYYAVSGIGAVCHTINPRLFDEQIVYIVNHAQDRLLFVESELRPARRAAAPAIARRSPHRAARTGRDEPADRRDARRAGRVRERGRLRLARVRRMDRVGAVLHLGDDRPAEGRPLHAPLDLAARLRRLAAGRHPGVEPRRDLSGRPDVPRLRLERAVLRADERREARIARPPSRRRQPLRIVRGRGRHLEPRRADRVARLRGASGGDRGALFDLPPHPVGRRGGAALDDHRVRAARHRGDPGLGDDRDEPGRHRPRC